MAITHNEVRRHPRWREQVNAPASERPQPSVGVPGARGIVVIGTVVLVVALVLRLLGV